MIALSNPAFWESEDEACLPGNIDAVRNTTRFTVLASSYPFVASTVSTLQLAPSQAVTLPWRMHSLISGPPYYPVSYGAPVASEPASPSRSVSTYDSMSIGGVHPYR